MNWLALSEQEQATEFSRRRNMARVEVRIMSSQRCQPRETCLHVLHPARGGRPMTRPIVIPHRLAFTADPNVKAAVGYPGSFGDAGWTTYRALNEDDAVSFMRDNQAARMPAWTRIEKRLRAKGYSL